MIQDNNVYWYRVCYDKEQQPRKLQAMRRCVAIDFDGTIAQTDFPIIIEPIPEAVTFIKDCKQLGVAVILWTCRTDRRLQEAIDWCEEQGLEFDAINDNLPDWIEAYHAWQPDDNPNGRKVAADIYIDDKALGGIDWPKANEWLRTVTQRFE